MKLKLPGEEMKLFATATRRQGQIKLTDRKAIRERIIVVARKLRD